MVIWGMVYYSFSHIHLFMIVCSLILLGLEHTKSLTAMGVNLVNPVYFSNPAMSLAADFRLSSSLKPSHFACEYDAHGLEHVCFWPSPFKRVVKTDNCWAERWDEMSATGYGQKWSVGYIVSTYTCI